MKHYQLNMKYILIWLSFMIFNIAQAQDPSSMGLFGDYETVSIATGAKKALHLAPSVATVITAEDIKAIGATSLDEALESVPGLHVTLSFNRLNSVYSFRGIHAGQNPQVLLLLNGVPLRQLFSGARPNNLRLPVSNIARIEVIRGPGSAVYGADAFAGVINVITYQAGNNGNTEAGVKGGSFNRKGGWASTAGQLGEWNILFNLESDKSDGDRGRVVQSDLQQAYFDAKYVTSASHAPGALDTRYDILTSQLSLSNQKWNIDFWQYRNKDAGVGPGAAQVLDPTGSQDTKLYMFDILYQSDNYGAWNWEGETSYLYGKSKSHFVLFPDGSRLPIGADGNINVSSLNNVDFTDGMIGNPVTTDEQATVEFRSYYQGWANHHWRFSLGAQRHKLKARSTQNFGTGVINGLETSVDGSLTDVSGTSNIYIPNREREIYYVSLQDEWLFQSDWEMTYGIRIDKYSDFGNTVNPRLALVWATDLNLTSKLLYGRAFRAPSFNELYAINNPSILGNPDLKPETIDTVELVFNYRLNNENRIQLDLFRYDIDDLIQYVRDDSGTSFTTQNTEGIEGYGYEIEGHWNVINTVLINTNYSWQLSRYKLTGQLVTDTPQKEFYLETRWLFIPQWHIGLEGYRVFDRKRSPTDTRTEIADYSWVNLTLRHKVKNSGWSLTGSIRNLTDEDAREPSNGRIADDYPLEGQSFYTEIRYQWE